MSSDRFIPFARAAIDDDAIEDVVSVLRSGWLTTGPRTKQFEQDFRCYTSAAHAVAVSSCTAALHLSLAALRIGPGDEVITSPLTFCATVNSIVHVGAQPVLADVGADGNLDLDAVQAALSERTRAILPVHFSGVPCRMDALWRLARQRGLHIIEDAAHASGASYQGRRIGATDPQGGFHSAATAFSFYATKNLTTGEGGMITTPSEELAARMRSLSMHGITQAAWNRYRERGSWRYEVHEPGFKYNMTDMQAALGLNQLRRLDAHNEARRRWATLYNTLLGDLEELELPGEPADVRSSWHLYVLRLHLDRLEITRSEFLDRLRERSVGASVHFIPIPLHAAYESQHGCAAQRCPRALALYPRLVSLPLYPAMQPADVERVAAVVRDVVTEARRPRIPVARPVAPQAQP